MLARLPRRLGFNLGPWTRPRPPCRSGAHEVVRTRARWRSRPGRSSAATSRP